MKKILLFVALMAGVFAVQAANGFTVFTVENNEIKEEIKDGDQVYAAWEDKFIPQYAAQIAVNSTSDDVRYMEIKIEPTETLPSNFTYQFCWQSCYSPSSFPWTNEFQAPDAATTFGNIWRLDIGGVTEDQLNNTYTLKVTLNNVEEEGDTLTFDLILTNDAGVEGIAADTTAPVYYSLDGRRVVNPENGLYIVRRGNKIEKVMIRK